MKCQVCKKAPAEWAWQPWGPDESPLSFALLGSHYRGYPVVKVCGFCKREAIENAKDRGEPVQFQFKGQEYVFDGERDPLVEYLWNGGKSADGDGMEYEMICRDTPTGHDIVGLVYVDLAPGLADELIDAYNKAHR